jgi:hypothetical protein
LRKLAGLIAVPKIHQVRTVEGAPHILPVRMAFLLGIAVCITLKREIGEYCLISIKSNIIISAPKLMILEIEIVATV